MDADAPFHSALAGDSRIAPRGQPLQCQGAFDGADHRAELDQDPITGRFDDPPAMLSHGRIGGRAMLAQCTRRARLVETHQPAVAGHIGGEDLGETAGGGHVVFALRLTQ
jgi:hypothetical protein